MNSMLVPHRQMHLQRNLLKLHLKYESSNTYKHKQFLLKRGNHSKSVRNLMLLSFKQSLYICWNIGGGQQQNIFQVVIKQA